MNYAIFDGTLSSWLCRERERVSAQKIAKVFCHALKVAAWIHCGDAFCNHLSSRKTKTKIAVNVNGELVFSSSATLWHFRLCASVAWIKYIHIHTHTHARLFTPSISMILSILCCVFFPALIRHSLVHLKMCVCVLFSHFIPFHLVLFGYDSSYEYIFLALTFADRFLCSSLTTKTTTTPLVKSLVSTNRYYSTTDVWI